MRKNDELANPSSCLNTAKPHEMIFVLKAHDITAPDTIRDWVIRRIAKGKNKPTDPQITEAMQCAEIMEQQQKEGI